MVSLGSISRARAPQGMPSSDEVLVLIATVPGRSDRVLSKHDHNSRTHRCPTADAPTRWPQIRPNEKAQEAEETRAASPLIRTRMSPKAMRLPLCSLVRNANGRRRSLYRRRAASMSAEARSPQAAGGDAGGLPHPSGSRAPLGRGAKVLPLSTCWVYIGSRTRASMYQCASSRGPRASDLR